MTLILPRLSFPLLSPSFQISPKIDSMAAKLSQFLSKGLQRAKELFMISQLSSFFRCHFLYCYRFLLSHDNSLSIHILYYLSISFLGFLALKSLNLRNPSSNPSGIDFFFTSVSATTVSSMSVVEMEAFSNYQLIVLMLLMFIGGEVFTSMIGLFFTTTKLDSQDSNQPAPTAAVGDLELCEVEENHAKTKSVRILAYSVMGYLLLTQVGWSLFILLYINCVSSVRGLLKKKGIDRLTFSIFAAVSSFANCGFLPTNESMMAFRKNSGLLLLMMPLLLIGNTLFPLCLRGWLWALKKATKKEEFGYLLMENTRDVDYDHLLPRLQSVMLAVTVLGFVALQVVILSSMEWRSEVFVGLSSFEKIVNGFFVSANSRFAGESTVDFSAMDSSVLVAFIVMMYLPSYTTFMPYKEEKKISTEVSEGREKDRLIKILIMPQHSYVIIFVMLVCITERRKLSEDPLNFNVFNIVFEVISAYGGVGFSTGYSCKRQLKVDSSCKVVWYGFSGRWSNQGKIILIVVMLFGRLKKFTMKGGQAWKLG